MASNDSLKTMFLVALILLCCFRCGIGKPNASTQTLNINPVSEFVGSVSTTIETLRQVIPTVSKLSNRDLRNIRLQRAVNDCVDLMDLSIDQLKLTSAASQDQNGGNYSNGTGVASADMKTWLSAALINQDTCVEGFEGTKHTLTKQIATPLRKINSLVIKMLSNVTNTTSSNSNSTHPHKKKGRKLIGGDKLPDWLGSHERNLLESATVNGTMADVVVAADGTGNFTTIEEALGTAPNKSDVKYVIYIKGGVYNEYLEIGKKQVNIMMIGDGINVTIITGNHNFIDGWTTFRSATFAVKGAGFFAQGITFENTAGPKKHQAVAFRSGSDLSVLFNCAFVGYQDTLYAHSMRQFYKDCHISGTVDFIFGDAAAVFQNCDIRARQGGPEQKNVVTAQGRKDVAENTAFCFQFCNISVEADVLNTTHTYLGRPWKMYSRTIIMQSYISNAIRPQGWLEWNGNQSLDTLFYGEYNNTGPGAVLTGRVKWPGYHILNTTIQARNFTVSQFLLGNDWLPQNGIEYTPGLVKVSE